MQQSNLPRPGDILLARVSFQETTGEKIRPVLILDVDQSTGRVQYAYGTSQINGIDRGQFVVDPLKAGVAGKTQLVKATKFCLLKTYWGSMGMGSLTNKFLGNILEIPAVKQDLIRAIKEIQK